MNTDNIINDFYRNRMKAKLIRKSDGAIFQINSLVRKNPAKNRPEDIYIVQNVDDTNDRERIDTTELHAKYDIEEGGL